MDSFSLTYQEQLFIAAQEGRAQAVASLLRRPNVKVDQETTDGYTALLIATLCGHAKVVEALLDKGADPTKEREDGSTPLYMAAQKGHSAVVKVFLKRGIDPNHAAHDGATPLFIAAYFGHMKVVADLLRQSDIITNSIGPNKFTPLLIAVQNGHLEVVNALLNIPVDNNLNKSEK